MRVGRQVFVRVSLKQDIAYLVILPFEHGDAFTPSSRGQIAFGVAGLCAKTPLVYDGQAVVVQIVSVPCRYIRIDGVTSNSIKLIIAVSKA